MLEELTFKFYLLRLTHLYSKSYERLQVQNTPISQE